jgi:hypothetical protein
MGKHEPVTKSKTTAQRLAEYAEALHSKGIFNFRAVVEGRTLTFDFGGQQKAASQGANPADLIDP